MTTWCFSAVQAQEYLANVQRYGVENGLSHRRVYDIYQDQNGFLWIATQYGLNKYDGHTFTQWTKERQGLSSNNVNLILEDDAGWLWVFNMDNWFHKSYAISLSLVHTESGKVNSNLQDIGPAAAKLPFQLDEVLTATGNAKHGLFFSLRNGSVFHYKAANGFRKIPDESSVLFQYDYITNSDTGEAILWGRRQFESKGVCYLQGLSAKNGDTLHAYQFPPEVEFVLFLHQDDQARLWLSLHSDRSIPKLAYYDLIDQNLHYLPEQEGVSWKPGEWSQQIFFQPRQLRFWLKSSPYFFVFNQKNEALYDFSEKHLELIESDINSVTFDLTDNAWIGTVDGLYKVTLSKNPFGKWLSLDEKDHTIQDSYSCRGIWAEGNMAWINTYKGRYEIDRNSAEVQQLPYIPNISVYGGQQYSMFYPLAIRKDRNDPAVWYADFALVKRERSSGEEQAFHWEDGLLNGVPLIWSLYQTPTGQMWLGTSSGLGYLDDECQCLRKVAIEDEFDQGTIHSMQESFDQTIWVTTSQGIYRWSPTRGLIGKVDFGLSGTQLDQAFHLYEGSANTLWLATSGSGLVKAKLDKTRLKVIDWKQYTVADGLPSNALYAVYPDDYGRLWMSSDYGIIGFDTTSTMATTYLPSDGVSHYEFNRISHHQDSMGNIYFGGLNGVTHFHPKQLLGEVEALEAPLRITDFQQLDGRLDSLVNKLDDLLHNQSIVLEPGDRFFRLQYALLNYSENRSPRYAWKIEGFDQNWKHSPDNFVQVSGLPPGSYELQVRGQSADGRWSIHEIILPILVKPFFYQRLSFWLLVILGLAVIAVMFFRWRTRSLRLQQQALEREVEERTKTIRNQSEKLRELDEAKTRFFANVSHELRTPLTLILGPLNTLLKEGRSDGKYRGMLELARKNSTNLLRLVNSILDLSKLESGKLKLDQREVAIVALLDRLVAQFHSGATIRGISLNLSHSLDPDLRIVLDKDKFEIIVNNLVSNALKFTNRNGRVDVQLKDMGRQLELLVKDTGRGIHPDDLPYIFDRYYQSGQKGARVEGGSGIGLAICKEYAELMGGSLGVESTYEEGSMFHFVFPKREVIHSTIDEEHVEIGEKAGLEQPLEAGIVQVGTFVSEREPLILIAEDNHDLRLYLQSILGQYYRLALAENGQIALEYLRTNPVPDLIISDVMMPIMDGFEFLSTLKSNDHWRHLPVVMLTARAEWRDKLRALRIGVDDYMLKPFEEEELLARVENLIRNRQEREANRSNTAKSEAQRPRLSSADERWLQEQEQVLLENYGEPNFTASQWAGMAAVSERQLQRKIKALTGLSPYQYLVELRMTEARKLLEDRYYAGVAEVAYAVGFTNTQSFSRNFSKRFGRTPSSYL